MTLLRYTCPWYVPHCHSAQRALPGGCAIMMISRRAPGGAARVRAFCCSMSQEVRDSMNFDDRENRGVCVSERFL